MPKVSLIKWNETAAQTGGYRHQDLLCVNMKISEARIGKDFMS